jgi:DNA-binding NtrC family response regulator
MSRSGRIHVVDDEANAGTAAERLLLDETRELRARIRERFDEKNVVGSTPAMQHLFELVDQVAPTRASVLISGEPGTGKELVANRIHQGSPRGSGPFVKVHCAGLAEPLLESELFGHEQGAFIGAMARKDGQIQLADGGTLFLDEVGESSPAIQVKLLRFLDDRAFERVGGNQTINVDVRVIASTSRDLHEDVVKGRFRGDLYFRLDVIALELPPLRDRLADIPALANKLLERHAKSCGKTISSIAPEALAQLMAYDWPGNVFELESVIERALAIETGSQLQRRNLALGIQSSFVPPGVPSIPGATLDELERYAILETLKATHGSTSKAAEILRISVRTIQYRLRQYDDPSSRGGLPVRVA